MRTVVLGEAPNMREGARRLWENVDCTGFCVALALEHCDRQSREHDTSYPCRCPRCEGADRAYSKAIATHAKAYGEAVTLTCNWCGGIGYELQGTEGYQTEGVEYKEWQECGLCGGTGLDPH